MTELRMKNNLSTQVGESTSLAGLSSVISNHVEFSMVR